MRSVDYQVVEKIVRYWHGQIEEEVCPSLADIESFLALLDGHDVMPGDAFTKCPSCGEEHRWKVLSSLIFSALELQPAREHRLFTWAREKLSEEYSYFGGKDAYEKYLDDANEFFAKTGAKNFYLG